MLLIWARLKWAYQKLNLSNWMPFLALIAYTAFGGLIFRTIERGPDVERRENYRNRTEFALSQVIDRMLEVKCHDPYSRQDRLVQEKHAKEAILWFLDHLSLTIVIHENTDETPWTWFGAMFYAGQLYTTIGYGVPITKTRGGRIATIFYILFGIPIFLIILKDMGRLLSRSLRKFYKRLKSSKHKIAQVTPLHKITLAGKTEKEDEKLSVDVEQVPPLYAGQENKKLKHDTSFPIWIALTILIFWILFSASLFCIWEREWGFVTSVYFYFVSISTVGLGDIVFQNPEMMIFNFALILVGLALLSMCFNLIQASIEKMLDRLLDEYIEEIEKMAEIVTNEDGMQEEAIPLEFKMTGNLLSLPMKRVANESGFLAEAKEWMAGRIANNLLASRLGSVAESDSEGEEEKDEFDEKLGSTEKLHIATIHNNDIVNSVRNSRRPSRISYAPSERSSGAMISSRLRHNRPLFNTIKTLEKIRPKNDNFKSQIFSKFVQSDKLNRLIDDSAAEPRKVVTTSCQTDVSGCVEERKTSRRIRHLRMDSNSSYSTMFTNSVLLPDDDSLMSAAFCDLKFDYSTDPCSPPSIHKNSSQSIFKIDDDDIMKVPQKIQFNPRMPGLPPPVPRKLSQQRQVTSPEQGQRSDETKEILMNPRRLASLSDIDSKQLKLDQDELTYARTICGLLPHDFDSPSQSTTTSQIDSGFEPSRRGENKDQSIQQ